MHLRSARAWMVCVIAATLLLPAAGSLAQSDLERLRDEREAILAKIKTHEAQANSLEDKKDELNDSLITLRKQLDKLTIQLTDVRAEVRSVQARIDEKEAQIAKIRTIATEQARSLYMSGESEVIDALLDAKSLTELDDRIALLDVASQEHTGALVKYSRLKAEIEEDYRQLYEKKEELEGTKAETMAYKAELDKRKGQLTDVLNKLEKKLGAEHSAEEKLEAAIDKKVRAYLASNQTNAIPDGVTISTGDPSAYGFIWPLNGAINSPYGMRWGRMHTGIDIDGDTGDPIVASKAGRVILAQSYYGYGNAVIIDHGGGFATLYGHMSAFNVSRGQVVAQGQIVGQVGCTGSCTGPHLHFEVRVNGTPRDPLAYLP
jgi:murein DD-endopeptidase MepM/ murein hydrolase activator NlpD